MKCRADTTCRVAALMIAFAFGATCPAGVVHVDAGAPGGGDGASWETAFDDLAAGLAAAGAGDEVWVAAGVYVESVTLPDQVDVYGGFAGDEESRGQRDWVVNETILSGDRNGDDGPDFENYDDNHYHVVRAAGVGAGTRLDGFTVTGGNARSGIGGGLIADGSGLLVRNCVFRRNRAEFGGGLGAGPGGSLTVEDCSFIENWADVRGGGLDAQFVGAVNVTGCLFEANYAEAGGGGALCLDCGWVGFTRCVFRDNASNPGGIGIAGGLLVGLVENSAVVDCAFIANQAGFQAGGLGFTPYDGTIINCAFSRNQAGDDGGGLVLGVGCTVINSTFGNNIGNGVNMTGIGTAVVINSIAWGNSPGAITLSSQHASPVVTYSDVEGGWPGDGNIDADPLFVQPGTDDLRLSFGSPCVDAGSNDAVPPGVEFDLDGNPRIQNGTVDMGAYEGEHDGQPARAETDDADDGESVVLVPNGGGFEPESNTLVIFTNRSGEDDASASLTEYEQNRHPGARGFSSLGITAILETSLDDGAFFAQMFIPFGEEDLGGADPFALDLTYYDESVGNWALAVGKNTARSPGHRGAIGDRITREGPGPWGVTLQLGDYGVFFNPETGRGFVWANVDHAADFSSGLALCPADTHQPPDSSVDFDDILAVIDNWGEGPGPFDVNGDGTVDVDDLFLVLSNWGGCD